ncbi:hypothetical protein BsWGS_15789 [Bradybaena similaris]
MMDDLIPTKDVSNNALKNLTAEAAQQRRQVSRLTKDELEDKYLRMYEEYIILKKHARKQEDRIKRMATKLLRLVSDKKKLEKEGKGGASIEVQEKFEEFTAKIRELEKQNSHLRDKLMLTKQQLTSIGPKRTIYQHVHARINTGLPPGKQTPQTSEVYLRGNKNLRVLGPALPSSNHQLHASSPAIQYGNSPVDTSRPSVMRYGHTMQETFGVDRKRMDDINASMREQIHVYEMEIETLKEQLKLREAEYEEDILKIKQQITSEQKINLQENIDMIKLQREVKEKSTMLIALQERYQQLEDSTRAVKQSHDQILRELEHLSLQLQEEQNRNLSLQQELKQTATERRKAIDLQEQVSDLKKECEVLKEANQNLVSSAFDLEREREWRKRENALKVQLAQLEATLKSDLGEKGSIIDRYAQEREAHEKLQDEHRTLRIEYYTLKEQMDDLNQKMKFFTKESEVDFTEIEEALVLIKQKKQREQQPPDFLLAVDDELNKDHKKALLELQAEYAETVYELEKTRNMLVVQHKINKDYQTEVNMATSKMEDIKKEYEMKLDEYARLLDIRAARIKKLEAQLRDVAYGTRQYKLPAPDDDTESVADFDETVNLERGQNLFEIHIQQVSLTKEALDFIGDQEPSLFCTWEFFEFEIQSTPVMRGARPVFDFTSQYIVKVDDFFLHHLQKDSCTVELHQSLGQDYKTFAACQLVFREIFDKSHGRIHGTASLTGVADGETGIGYGTIDYWVRLRVPMEQALRLYKERTKALGYIMTNERLVTQALEALDEVAAMRPPDNVNEMHVKVIRCSKLQSRRLNVQPSPYCAYKLLDFPDNDTIIIRSSNNPEFNDHKIYSIPVTFELDQYLRTAKLQVFVFDDTDPELDAYLGVAEIPLLPLAHNKPIAGEFQLTRGEGKVPVGIIEVELKWQYHYLPPKVAKHEPQELERAPDEPPQRLKPEGQPSRDELVKSVRTPNGTKKRKGPTATSTPLDKERLEAVEAQIIQAGPKPVSRRKVIISEQQSSYNGANAVDDTVSQVVSGFIPGVSQTMSSVTGVPRESTVEESDEGEELSARPAPSRSSLRMESGSEDGGSRDRTPKASPVRSASASEQEVEQIEEEIEEEFNEEGTPEAEAADSARQSEVSEGSEPTAVESDSEGVMVVQHRSRQKKGKTKSSDTLTIVVSEVSFEPNSPPMLDDNIKQLYVEYRFYGVDPAETETPFSLPKPRANQPITFNFSKTIPVDIQNHYERRRYLASMLLPNHSDGGRLKFTVVSEPPENMAATTEMECEDVGVAYVDMRKMLETGKNLRDHNINLLDAATEKTVIGQMKVTVECVDVLKEVEGEMQIDGTY